MSYIIKGVDDKPILHQGQEIVGMDFLGVVKGVDLEKRLLKMTGTDETRDRDGDVVKMSGWMIDNYLKNPVFLWAHDYRSVPLASAQKVVKRRNPASMEFHLRFPTIGLYPFADMILNLYAEQIINASSVGFIPYKWEDLTEEEKEGMSPMAQVWGGRKFVSQELLELSGCAVPSNPNALQNAIKNLGGQMAEEAIKISEYLSGKAVPEIPDNARDDVLGELHVHCDFVDETEPQIHQVPIDINKEVSGEDILEEEVTKPYPNEHACRLKDPGDFEKFRRGKREHDGKTYSVIYGKKKDDDSWAEQAYRYNKETWTAGEARSHCGSHDGSFEAASSSQQDFIPDVVRFTAQANEQFEKTDYGQVILYGNYSDENGIIITDVASTIPPEERDSMIREMYSEEFEVNIPEDKDFTLIKQETLDIDGAKTVISYLKLNKGIMQCSKKEVIDSKDSEPGGKAGTVLSRTNRELFTKARDILDEVLKAEELPDKTGADETTLDLQVELEKIKNIINNINKSFGG